MRGGGAPSCGRRGSAAPWDAGAERGNAAPSSHGTRRQRGVVAPRASRAPPPPPRPGLGPPTRRGTNPGIAGGGAGRAGNGAPGPAPPGRSLPAPRGSSGGAGGHPLTFPGLSWTAAFPPALCLLGRPALPSCVPPGAGGGGGIRVGTPQGRRPGEPHRAPMAASAAALRTASPAHAAGTRGVHRHCAHCSAHGCAHGTHAGAEDAGCA